MKIFLGFRKLFVTLLAIVLATIFLLTHHIDGKTFGDIVKGCVVAFAASNTGEWVMKTMKDIFKKDNK